MGIMRFFKKQQQNKEVKSLQKQTEEVVKRENEMSVLSDEELCEKTKEFKERLLQGETMEEIKVEAFAVAREATKRVLNMHPYPVQLMGGFVLHNGDIAEMKTGEGKTLISIAPAYLNALTEKGVHIITVNDYLAERDATITGKVFTFLGLTVGLNTSNKTKEEKRQAYSCDIIYGTNHEFGFDYLRDNMVRNVEDRVQRGLHYAIIDEVDSILIDEARTPLIISGQSESNVAACKVADDVIRTLKETDVEIDVQTKTVQLTEEGIQKVEKMMGISNLFDTSSTIINHFIQNALKAHFIYKKDVDYVVANNEVCLIDGFTGRVMDGRRYSDGLHQALEQKEKVEVKEETKTLGSITYQNYFRMYKKLAGMTGTALTEEEEFREIYNMMVVPIPTNKPVIREDAPDCLFMTKEAKFRALVKEVVWRNAKGQPILIGTADVDTSEYISLLLSKENLDHVVLNAKNHALEAEIVAKAGEKGAITVATNMAGRGTDIQLGEGVVKLGGLCVLGTERHENRRIDDQLRGRSGRQGDPGFSQFYISMEDDLIKRFGGERLKQLLEKIGTKEDERLESSIISKRVEAAQERVEGNNYDMRKQVLQYDDVLNQQRKTWYETRNYILENKEKTEKMMEDMVIETVMQKVDQYTVSDIEEEWELEELEKDVSKWLKKEVVVAIGGMVDRNEIKQRWKETVLSVYQEKIASFSVFSESVIRMILLETMDRLWVEHLETMAHLKEGIHLRAYGQIDPIRAYQMEGFEIFELLLQKTKEEATTWLFETTIDTEVVG